MKRLMLIVLIVLLNVSIAYAENNPFDYDKLLVNVRFSNQVTMTDSTNFIANSSILPRDYANQRVVYLVFIGNESTVKISENDALFEWNSVNKVNFGWDAMVETSLYTPRIYHTDFPWTTNKFVEYKLPSEVVDINQGIINKANELVAGKRDLFEALTAVAEYVYSNMTYDEGIGQKIEKASNIFKDKRGVCVEYSTLFIALVRALGLPARYVSGIAYSNIKNSFGNHAWVEVYMPEGWIPFDPTYGQYGWLDATHIALSKRADAHTTVLYAYKMGVDVTPSELVINTSIKEFINKINGRPDILEFSISPIKPEVGLGSYVPIRFEIKNLADYYLPVEVYLTESPRIMGKNMNHLVIEPNSKGESFLIVKLPDVEAGYRYTIPLKARTQFKDVAETSVDFSQNYETISLEKAQNIISALLAREGQYGYGLILNCSPAKSGYYKGEQISVRCEVTSNSNSLLLGLNLCIKSQCAKFDLPINSRVEKEFNFPSNETDYIATVSNDKVSESQFFIATIIPKPSPEVVDLNPKTINFTNSTLEVSLRTESFCTNLSLRLNNYIFTSIGEMVGNETFEVNIEGKDVLNGVIKARITCYDLNGEPYSDDKEFRVEVMDVPWFARIFQFFLKLFS